MTEVKICGVTRECDIDWLNRYLPDYAGFVFAESKRKISPENAEKLIKKLDKKIKKVGVFVNADKEEIIKIADYCHLDIIQLHGDEEPEYILELNQKLKNKKIEIWKAIRVKDKESINSMKDFTPDVFVLDTYIKGSYGGAGKKFNWGLALEGKKYGKIILAGGLNKENVEEAIKTVKPFAVDVSSGVESDGRKDEKKIKDFICFARHCKD